MKLPGKVEASLARPTGKHPLKSRASAGNSLALTQWGVNSEYGVLRDVLIGPIDHYRWEEVSSIVARSKRLGLQFDHAVAKLQWREMVSAFEHADVRCHFLPADPSLTYSVFARDSSVMTPWGAIITQMFRPVRRGEYAPCIEFYLQSGIPIWDVVTAGALEGGDMIVAKPGLVLCGMAERTSQAGFAQMKSWFELEGWEVIGYPFDPFFLHLDAQVAIVNERLAVVCEDALESSFLRTLKDRGFECINVPFKSAIELGVNLVSLGRDRVMIPASNTSLIEACRAHGLYVYDPDVSMISGGGGAIHCMTQALRRDQV